MKAHTLSSVLISGSITLALGLACSETKVAPSAAEGAVFEALAHSDTVVAEVEAVLRPLERDPGAQRAGPLEATVRTEQVPLYLEPAPDAEVELYLLRGHQLAVLETGPGGSGMVRVLLADGTTGFVEERLLLRGAVEELLAFDNSPVYEGPESTFPPLRSLRLGTPVFAVSSEGPWVEVVLPEGTRGWMLNTDLAREPDELSAACS